ncbi:MAG: hydroxypyruvate isomerase family protein [Stellaceae bacterium]
MQLSANIAILFRERDFVDRFDAAAGAGFVAAECWAPYDHPVAELRRAISDAGIPLIGINTTGGDPAKGEIGLAGLPGREREFDAALAEALDYGAQLGVRHVHILAGAVDGFTAEEGFETLTRNLTLATRLAEQVGLTLVIEPLNRRDRPGCLLASSEDAARIIDRVGSPSLKMMFDFYHLQIMEGDVIRRFERLMPKIGHVQIAAVPSRAEPDEGELDYGWLLPQIDRLGWAGYVGAEYRPRGRTEEGLGWLRQFGLIP